MTKPETLSDFAGAWRFTRVIEDAFAGQTATADGTATWQPDGVDQMIYEEHGALYLPDAAPMQMHRRYIWQADERGVDVCFDTGMPFHRFHFHQSSQEDIHLCAPDIYKVRYAFAGWPEWNTIWAVSGPKKNYIMRTEYTAEV